MRSQFHLKKLFSFQFTEVAINFWSILLILALMVILRPAEVQCGKNKSDMFLRDKLATSEVTVQSNELSFSKSDDSIEEETTDTTTDTKELATNTSNEKLAQISTESTTSSDTLVPEYAARSSFIPSASLSTPSSIESFGEGARSTHRMGSFLPIPSSSVGSLNANSTTSTISGEDASQPKSAVPTLLLMSTLGTMATSTRRSTLHYHHTPSSTIIIRKSSTIRPVLISTSKPPKVRPVTPIPTNLIVRKRKRRPKPGRTTTTTTTTTPSPEEYDYYDSGESGEETKRNKTNVSNSTTPTPLSKLAMAMIASSSGFDNSTGEELFYPQTPAVNLLNILQAYTKQMQMTNDSQKKPVVKIPNTPFMLNLNQLNFAAKIGISFYYSLIAIIPLIYLAFGGIGRLGLLDNFIGRRNGSRKRRKRNAKQFGKRPNFQNDILERADLDNDDYAWIIARISQIILEISVFSDAEEE